LVANLGTIKNTKNQAVQGNERRKMCLIALNELMDERITIQRKKTHECTELETAAAAAAGCESVSNN
jgi:hypothetical protein